MRNSAVHAVRRGLVCAKRRAGARAGRGTGVTRGVIFDSENSAGGLMNSSITAPGVSRTGRLPARQNSLGYDSDVFDLRGALRHGADRFHIRLGSRKVAVRRGRLCFLRADARRADARG